MAHAFYESVVPLFDTISLQKWQVLREIDGHVEQGTGAMNAARHRKVDFPLA